LSSDQKSIKYTIDVKNMDNVTMAHIHQDKRGENDPVVVVLYKATAPTGPKHGILPQGSITASQSENLLKGKQISDLVKIIMLVMHTQTFTQNRIQKERSENEHPNRRSITFFVMFLDSLNHCDPEYDCFELETWSDLI
jgi:hypothetical protein